MLLNISTPNRVPAMLGDKRFRHPHHLVRYLATVPHALFPKLAAGVVAFTEGQAQLGVLRIRHAQLVLDEDGQGGAPLGIKHFAEVVHDLQLHLSDSSSPHQLVEHT
eukprot:6212763-Pleurochrysis_carterae.AAC.4